MKPSIRHWNVTVTKVLLGGALVLIGGNGCKNRDSGDSRGAASSDRKRPASPPGNAPGATEGGMMAGRGGMMADGHGGMMGPGMMGPGMMGGHGGMMNGRTGPNSGADSTSSGWRAPAFADTLRNPVAGESQAQADGGNLYQAQCLMCHGPEGKGDGAAGAALNPPPSDLTSGPVQSQTDGALFWKISIGNPPMPAWEGILTERQRWDLVDYMRNLARTRTAEKQEGGTE